MVDVTGYYGVEPLEGFRTILAELDAHAADLAGKPQVVVLNKIDAVPPETVRGVGERLRRRGGAPAARGPPGLHVRGGGRAASRPAAGLAGVGRHRRGAERAAAPGWVRCWRELPAPESPVAEPVDGARAAPRGPWSERTDEGGHVTYRPAPTGATELRRAAGTRTGFVVKGKAVRRLVSRFDLDNEEAIRYLAERLDRLGVYAALRARGAQPGDDVDIEGYTFEFQ